MFETFFIFISIGIFVVLSIFLVSSIMTALYYRSFIVKSYAPLEIDLRTERAKNRDLINLVATLQALNRTLAETENPVTEITTFKKIV